MAANLSNWKFPETLAYGKDGPPTADERAIESRRLVIATGLLSLLPSIGCGMNSPSTPNNSLTDLAKMIRIPAGVTKAQWEIVTLPESKSSDLPGPADYVCLIAVIHLPQTNMLSLSEITASNSIQKPFARQWLPKQAIAAITRLGAGTRVFDIKGWVIRKSIRSYGIAIPDGLVLYIEYIAPSS